MSRPIQGRRSTLLSGAENTRQSRSVAPSSRFFPGTGLSGHSQLYSPCCTRAPERSGPLLGPPQEHSALLRGAEGCWAAVSPNLTSVACISSAAFGPDEPTLQKEMNVRDSDAGQTGLGPVHSHL